ncbi:MAG: sulfatase family protein [Limisphaerales bacterium]
MRPLPLMLYVLFTVSVNLIAAEKPPNIIIIFADDLGYADVVCYGAKGLKTPNIDRLAKEGIRFTDFYVAQPVCSASRAALLTGCYPNRIGISGALSPSSKIGINQNEINLAELLKQKGYATAIIGKWHLGHHSQFLPTRHGFDEYFGLPYSNDMWPLHPEAKPGTYPPLPLYENETIINPNVLPRDQEQLTTQYTERAVRFIEKNKNRPFFLYLAHSMPHVPLYVSDKFKGKSKIGLYGDVIMEIDWSVGQILEAIKRNNLDDNTLIIFTSDNGPWLSYGNHAGKAAPLREGKGTVFEGGVRVPFIARWSGKIPKNSICKEPAMTIDLFPTIAFLSGAPMPTNKIDSLNIWELLSAKPNARSPHTAFYFYYNVNELQAIRSGKWKLILPHTYRTLKGSSPGKDGLPGKYMQVKIESPELYDLEKDISESENVAAKYPEIVNRLLELAEQMRHELGDSLTKRTGIANRPAGKLE